MSNNKNVPQNVQIRDLKKMFFIEQKNHIVVSLHPKKILFKNYQKIKM